MPNKISIMLAYYNRPILLRNAIRSVLEASKSHNYWRLLIGDDGSPIPAEPIAKELLFSNLDKVDFIRSTATTEEKLKNGISIGKFANEYLIKSDCDIGITLCDDDILASNYLKNLSNFYEKNPDVMYAYSKLKIFNPLNNKGASESAHYNVDLGDQNPAGRLDASQLSFRIDVVRKHGVRFPETTSIGNMPYLANLDLAFLDQLYKKFGKCICTGFVGQIKGVHDYQMIWHKKQGIEGLRNYISLLDNLGGKEF